MGLQFNTTDTNVGKSADEVTLDLLYNTQTKVILWPLNGGTASPQSLEQLILGIIIFPSAHCNGPVV